MVCLFVGFFSQWLYGEPCENLHSIQGLAELKNILPLCANPVFNYDFIRLYFSQEKHFHAFSSVAFLSFTFS